MPYNMGLHITFIIIVLCVFYLPVNGQEKVQSILLDSVVVDAKRQKVLLRQGGADGLLLDMRLMDNMPKILGNADPVHYAQMLPGVQTNNEYQGGIHVQGSDNEHNELSVAGVPLFNVNHLLGFFSTFNSSHFASMQLKESARDAAFSNRLGAQLKMIHEECVVDSVTGEMSLGLISSQGTVRLPMGKKSMLSCSGRFSYINALYGHWLKADGNSMEYSFYDLNATYVTHPSPQHTFTVDAYLGNDRASMLDGNYNADAKDRWGNAMSAVHWDYRDGNRRRAGATLYVTSYNNRFGIDMAQEHYSISSSITDVGLKGSCGMGNVSVGAEAIFHSVKPQSVGSSGRLHLKDYNERRNRGMECSVFCNSQMRLASSTMFNVGVRGSLFHSAEVNYKAVNPSVSMIHYCGDTKVSLTYAMRTQYLFQTGFSDMGLPTEFWLSASKERSPQYVHGVELMSETSLLGGGYLFSASAYYKKLYRQLEYNGTVLDLVNTNYDINNKLLHGDGVNYGFNVMISKCAGRLTGWACYSYGKAQRTFVIDGVSDKYPANHDRTHEVNVVATYALGRHWSCGMTMVACSGTPFTAPECVYVLNGNLMTQMSKHNSNRLKTYARADLSVNYKWPAAGGRERGVNFSLYNVICKNNDLFHYMRVNSKNEMYYRSVHFISPILPSISYYMKF